MENRREFLKGLAGGLAVAGGAILTPAWAKAAEKLTITPSSLTANNINASTLETLPGKKPLIKRTFRAPNYETPVAYFNSNNCSFVRLRFRVLGRPAASRALNHEPNRLANVAL